ncbi:MAG: universal stress protein [Gammaproteobacteria bacterium]|nr:universal stress protein [Gammaproteobacteria bacterium]
MEYKDILVYLDDGASNAERIKTALSLAAHHNARLTAVTLDNLQPKHLKITDAKAIEMISKQDAQKRMDDFNLLAEKKGIESACKIITNENNSCARRLAQFARNFDIIILRQARPKSRNHALMEDIAEQVLLLSGRPVFFMPYIGAHRIPCQKAIIAWDGTPAATRAVHDTLPILQCIGDVVILCVREGKKKTAKGELLADDLSAHLKRHNIDARVKRINAGTFDVPTVILNVIAESDSDLIIMGGYGTPSLRQKIFGGVTSTLLANMTIPVVMSH